MLYLTNRLNKGLHCLKLYKNIRTEIKIMLNANDCPDVMSSWFSLLKPDQKMGAFINPAEMPLLIRLRHFLFSIRLKGRSCFTLTSKQNLRYLWAELIYIMVEINPGEMHLWHNQVSMPAKVPQERPICFFKMMTHLPSYTACLIKICNRLYNY